MNLYSIGPWLLYTIFVGLGLCGSIYIIGWQRSMQNPRRLSFLFIFFMGMTYLVRPPLSYLLGDGYEYADIYGIPISNLPLTGALIAIAFVSFAIGYQREVRFIGDGDLIFRPEHNATVTVCALALVFMGYLARFVAPTEQIETYAGGSINATGLSFIGLGWLFIPAGLILFYANTARLTWTALLGFAFLLLSVRDGYGRYIFLTLIIGLASTYLLRRYQTGVKQLLALGSIIAFFYVLFIVIGLDRIGFVESGDIGRNVDMLKHEKYYDILGDFAGFEGTIYQVNMMAEEKPDYGTALIYNLIIQPIPRILWHTKPLPPEFTWQYIMGRTSGADDYRVGDGMLFYTNQVKGHVGYALQGFGYGGVILLFLFEGWLLGRVERWFATSRKGPCEVATYAVCYVLLIFAGRNTVFDYLTRYVIYFLAPYFVIWWLASRNGTGVGNALRRRQECAGLLDRRLDA